MLYVGVDLPGVDEGGAPVEEMSFVIVDEWREAIAEM
jgi:hypothetical protein